MTVTIQAADMIGIHDKEKDTMKKLGLVGGMGPESTIPYYHDIVYGVQKAVGKAYFPNLSIESIDVFEVLRLCREEQFPVLTEYLLRAVCNLKAGGAEIAALSANTPHIVFDELQKRSPLPLISIVDAACLEAQKRKYTKLGLLGTIFTMTKTFFKDPFISEGIDIAIPQEAEVKIIDEKVSKELELGIVKEETRRILLDIIKRMKKEDGIQAVILGCTELPLILNDDVTPVPCLDTMKIHVQALVNAIMEK